MEQQTDLHSSQDIQTCSVTTVRPEPAASDDSVSTSVPTLRFPRPQGNQILADWVSTSSPDIMAPPPSPPSTHSSQDDDSTSLSDSTYEFIEKSDNGSLDSEAISASPEALSSDAFSSDASEDERYPHPDEVRSYGDLNDMGISTTNAATFFETASDTDSEDELEEEDVGTGSSLSPSADMEADDFLQDTHGESSVTTIFAPTSASYQPVVSIEFSEPEDVDVHIDKISVKHTIKEFSEEEAAEFYSLTELGPVPGRVSATIRQTMSQRCLSTHEPLRVFYVGNDKYKHDIILKLSRAITSSFSVDDNESKTLCRNTDGVCNLVPVSSGTIKVQIKVDTCIGAEKKALDSRYFRNDIIYSLTVDGANGGKRYSSVPAAGPDGARVQPAWSLPHVAIFCVSEEDEDDKEMQDRLRTAWELCDRHAIPTLFISDHPVYAASVVAARWMNHTNEDAVCLCLESRDGNHEQRFPIDLDSFINIDNRQMNQNLAYLTGLQEPDSVADEKMKEVISLDGSEQDFPGRMDKDPSSSMHSRLKTICPDVFLVAYDAVKSDWKADLKRQEGKDKKSKYFSDDSGTDMLHPCFWSILAVMLMLTSTAIITTICMPAAGNGVALVTGDGSLLPTGIPTAPPSVETVTIKYTTTKTVSIPPAQTDTVRFPESAAFGGLLSDIAHTVGADRPKSTAACSAELYSDTEVLIKVPSGTKEAWLAHEAIAVNVYRDETRIPSRLSSISEGIIIQIPNQEAYGVVNVSVVTTRKPKISEIYAVDFGTSLATEIWEVTQSAWQGFVKTIGSSADSVYTMVVNDYGNVIPPAEKMVHGKSQAWWKDMVSVKEAARDYYSQAWWNDMVSVKEAARDCYSQVAGEVHCAASLFKNAHNNAMKSTQQMIAEQQRRIEEFRETSDLAILKAQINSKLWWLKIQGKDKAYEEYEQQARDFLCAKRMAKLLTTEVERPVIPAACVMGRVKSAFDRLYGDRKRNEMTEERPAAPTHFISLRRP